MIRTLDEIRAYFARPRTAPDLADFNYTYPSEIPEAEAWLGTVLHENYLDPLAGLLAEINPVSYGVIGALFGTLESYLLQRYRPSRLAKILICDLDIPEYHPQRENGSYVYNNICSLACGAFHGEFIFLRADSIQTRQIIPAGPFDVFFVDGRHDHAGVYRDMVTAFTTLRPNGFLLVHDIDLDTSNVRAGYEQWVQEMEGQIDSFELRHPEFHLGLGIIQKRGTV